MRTRLLASVLSACMLTAAVACGGGGGAAPDDGPRVTERSVTFETTDGATLTGRLFGRSRVGVALAHEFPVQDASGWYTAARELARAGYMALAFNFRGYGDAEGPKAVSKAPLDIEAAAGELERAGAHDVVFAGASMGGTASVIAAQDQQPLAVVLVSAPTRFMGLDATIASTSVQRPVLLIASRGDTEAFRSLEEFERALPNPEDTKVYDGDAHGTNVLDDRPEAVDEIIRFLRRYAPLEPSIETPN